MLHKLLLFIIIFHLHFTGETQNVGIGTFSPNASALLELKDSTRGLLPPRMTRAQRDQLTPVEGLMIYNTTTRRPNFFNGIEWRNYDETSDVSIGMSYQGGMIYYLLLPGDSGYNPNQTHGLISSLSDQNQSIQWYNGTYVITGASGSVIGTGRQNTLNIISAQGSGSYAAKVCADLSLGGYTDWYLPSKNELIQLLYKRNLVGGFAAGDYWSSSELDIQRASYIEFSTGSGSGINNYKQLTHYLRAIRSF